MSWGRKICCRSYCSPTASSAGNQLLFDQLKRRHRLKQFACGGCDSPFKPLAIARGWTPSRLPPPWAWRRSQAHGARYTPRIPAPLRSKRGQASTVSIISLTFGLMMGSVSPARIACVKNACVTIALCGNPKEIFDTPSTVSSPNSILTRRTASSVCPTCPC